MKKWIANKTERDLITSGGEILPAGECAEMDPKYFGAHLVKKGSIEISDEKPEAALPQDSETTFDDDTPDNPDGGDGGGSGAGSDGEWTLDEVAKKIFEEGEDQLFDKDDYTKSNKIEVAALEEVFERDFTADERDQVMEKVAELKANGSDNQ